MVQFNAILTKEDDMYVALCPDIGTVSQGETIEAALESLKEATELYLEEFPLKVKGKSLLTTFDISNACT